jgi:hypothetical protein
VCASCVDAIQPCHLLCMCSVQQKPSHDSLYKALHYVRDATYTSKGNENISEMLETVVSNGTTGKSGEMGPQGKVGAKGDIGITGAMENP